MCKKIDELMEENAKLKEELARVEAERDEARFEVMSYSAQFDAAQAQLAEAVGLFWFIQGYLEEDRNVHVKARIRSFISRHRLDEHSQAKQQEGEYYCKVCRNHGCVSGCHPDYYKQQEAQGAQAVEETSIQAYQRGLDDRTALATQPAAYVLTKDGEIYWEGDDGIVISNTTGDCLDESYEWRPVGFTTQPAVRGAAHGDNK